MCASLCRTWGQLLELLQHPEEAVRLGVAGRALVEERFRLDVSSTSYELLFRCLRLCRGVVDRACGRRCASRVSHSRQ